MIMRVSVNFGNRIAICVRTTEETDTDTTNIIPALLDQQYVSIRWNTKIPIVVYIMLIITITIASVFPGYHAPDDTIRVAASSNRSSLSISAMSRTSGDCSVSNKNSLLLLFKVVVSLLQTGHWRDLRRCSLMHSKQNLCCSQSRTVTSVKLLRQIEHLSSI